MDQTNHINIKGTETEKQLRPASGIAILIINILLMLFSFLAGIFSFSMAGRSGFFLLIGFTSFFYFLFLGPFLFKGLKIVNPNEALVLTLFGKYIGTIKEAGFFFVNPFASAFNPTAFNS